MSEGQGPSSERLTATQDFCARDECLAHVVLRPARANGQK